MFEQEEAADEVKSQADLDFGDIDQVLKDFGNEPENTVELRDALMFIIDCRPALFEVQPGHEKCQFDQVVEGLLNTLKNKIISSPQDRVGLMLFNVARWQNELKFANIALPLRLEAVRAEAIRQVRLLPAVFHETYGLSPTPARFHQVLWLFNQEARNFAKERYQLRVFLFTSQEVPNFSSQAEMEMALNHAKKLRDQGVELELFPLRKHSGHKFNVGRFFSQILTVDQDQLNPGSLDSTAKIMQLQQRLRQKQHKKRTLSRVILELDAETKLGVKIYCTYSKARKPTAKKLDARSNSILKRQSKFLCQETGSVLYANQIQHFYPLGGQKVKLRKQEVAKMKSLQEPGLVLVGFKPRTRLKAKLNYRSSYFLYSDDERVSGSSKFLDALIRELERRGQMGIAKFVPRKGMPMRLVALLPQFERYDDDHFQVPPGMHVVFLPFAEDIAKPSISLEGEAFSQELLNLTKLLVNSLTLEDYHAKNFENPAIQKFYAHIQAHALNEHEVEEFQDLLQPDHDAFCAAESITQLIEETLDLQLAGTRERGKKSSKRDVSRKKNGPKREMKEEGAQDWGWLEDHVREGEHSKVKVAELKDYLSAHGLSTTGKKEELILRIKKLIS